MIEVVLDGPPTPAWQAHALSGLAESPVIDVVEVGVKLIALAVPNVTAVTSTKFVPVIVTGVSPLAGPFAGDNFLIVGGFGSVVSVCSEPVLGPPRFVAEILKS